MHEPHKCHRLHLCDLLPSGHPGWWKEENISQLPLFLKKCGFRALAFRLILQVMSFLLATPRDGSNFLTETQRMLGFQGTCKLSSQICVVLTTLTSHKSIQILIHQRKWTLKKTLFYRGGYLWICYMIGSIGWTFTFLEGFLLIINIFL